MPIASQERQIRLDYYYQQIKSVILKRQNPITGLLPASTAVNAHGDYTDACDFHPVDHAAIARACGVYGVRIEAAADFAPALEAALKADRTTVIDVMSDPNAHPPITVFEGKL